MGTINQKKQTAESACRTGHRAEAGSQRSEVGGPPAASVAIIAGSSQPTPLPACLRREEVAGLLQVSVSKVDRMAKRGDIRKVKIDRTVRYLRSDVEEFLKKT